MTIVIIAGVVVLVTAVCSILFAKGGDLSSAFIVILITIGASMVLIYELQALKSVTLDGSQIASTQMRTVSLETGQEVSIQAPNGFYYIAASSTTDLTVCGDGCSDVAVGTGDSYYFALVPSNSILTITADQPANLTLKY